jgi:hypothetical protein
MMRRAAAEYDIIPRIQETCLVRGHLQRWTGEAQTVHSPAAWTQTTARSPAACPVLDEAAGLAVNGTDDNRAMITDILRQRRFFISRQR